MLNEHHFLIFIFISIGLAVSYLYIYKNDFTEHEGTGGREREKQHLYNYHEKVYSSNSSVKGSKNLEAERNSRHKFHLNIENKYFNQTVIDFQIFIVDKHEKSLDKAWSTSYVTVKSNKTCIIYDGLSEKEIKSGKDLYSRLFRIYSRFVTNGENVCESYILVDPFKEYFIRVDSIHNVQVEYNFIHVDLRLIILCILALLLYIEAERISRNVAFYYASGISIGLIGSCLILLVIIYRFIPKKSAAIATFLTGSSLYLFSVQWIYYNIKVVLETFQVYIMAYLCLSVMISAMFLYYRGPFTDPKSFKIIEFILYLISGVLLYMGIAYKDVFTSLVIAIALGKILFYILTKFKSFTWFRNIRYKLFPPVRRLLTEEEYIREGQDFTAKSLIELKEYCNSPQCESWKTISRLKSPERFAKFVMNEQTHITEDEINEHERFSIDNDLIDEDL